jgi:hypothetical protein
VSNIGHQSNYLTELLGRLDDVVTDFDELSLLGLSLDELNTVLLRLTRLSAQSQGLQFGAIQEAEAAAMSVAFGSRVLTTHLAKTTHLPAKAVGADRAVAMWLNDFTLFHGAMVDGFFGRSHVLELKALDNVRIHSLLLRDQQMLVDAADKFAWPEWKQIVAYWLNAADPDGELSDPSDPKLGMRVRTRANGNVVVTIEMDPITGEAFLTMHDAEVKKLERNERERLNEDPNSPVTSNVRKNLHALLRLMVRGWRREDGSYPDFLVNIVMSEKVAEDLLARTFGHDRPTHGWDVWAPRAETPLASAARGIAWDDLDGRCETIRGTPIHPKHALGVLLAGRLRRMVMTAESKIVDHGTDIRFFNKTQTNALLVQQRGQCALGTQTLFRWLQGDHIDPASRGGPTDLANGQMINGADNQAKGNGTP